MNYHRMKFKLVLIAALLFPVLVGATPLFNNGPIDSARTTWNDTTPSYTNYDQFVLATDATITDLVYSVFMQSASSYSQSFISIFNGAGTQVIVPSFSKVGTVTSNGLTTSNPNVPNGFDIAINGLALDLSAGTYFIGFSTGTTSGPASIATGAGSAQSIGPGEHQVVGSGTPASGGLHAGDHISFRLNGSSAVPEPTTYALILAGLGLLGFSRRSNSQQQR